MQIKEDAIFIADAHYNFKRKGLKTLLEKIQKNELPCSQLFLMGDIFDFIANEVSYFKKVNEEVVFLIQELSSKIEVYYLEGNHDFNLKQIFSNIKVFPRQMQPVKMKVEEKSVELSHGDVFVGSKYELYCLVIRSSILLTFLNFMDIFGIISKTVEKKLANKKICHEIVDFESKIKKKIVNYSSDIVIEGHYHQGKNFTFDKHEYINIPSLACDKVYLRYKNKEFNKEKL